MTRSLRRDYEYKLASNCNVNVKQFWKYVNSRLKIRPSISALKQPDNSVTHSDQEKSELFNDFLQVYLQKKLPFPAVHFILTLMYLLPLTNFTNVPDVVYDKLAHLDPSKAPGPEGWPVLSFKENAQQLCIPLSILFSKSLEFGLLPNSWKEAFVTPVFKKGNQSCVDNYRPISLTSPVIKIMESIVRDSILDHVTVNCLLSPTQHGFTVGKSCITQLLTAANYWTSSLESGNSVDILYFDFTKAFDLVSHSRLLEKLEAHGITGKVLTWLRNFLIGRRQRVVLNRYSSSWSSVLSGVPEGSVLGPLLFNIYVNDMPNCVNNPILQFADDVKMFRAIGGAADFQQLQADINSLVDWSIKW